MIVIKVEFFNLKTRQKVLLRVTGKGISSNGKYYVKSVDHDGTTVMKFVTKEVYDKINVE